jgi:hypothetical protein
MGLCQIIRYGASSFLLGRANRDMSELKNPGNLGFGMYDVLRASHNNHVPRDLSLG